MKVKTLGQRSWQRNISLLGGYLKRAGIAHVHESGLLARKEDLFMSKVWNGKWKMVSKSTFGWTFGSPMEPLEFSLKDHLLEMKIKWCCTNALILAWVGICRTAPLFCLTKFWRAWKEPPSHVTPIQKIHSYGPTPKMALSLSHQPIYWHKA